MRVTGASKYTNELKIRDRTKTINEFLGLTVTCRVIKHQI